MWFCLSFKENRAARPKALRVESESAHDVKQWAALKFPGEKFEVELLVRAFARPDVTMRWEGSDAGARPGRKLVVVEHLCLLCYGLERPVECEGCGGAGYLEEGCHG